tara:strand:+ start:280 stop:1581 length:1302 start_codon:yes stop_codon:yes gene_type:complete
MSAIDKSQYEEIVIESADGERTVDISAGAIAIDYYEDVLSPTITCKITVVNTGNVIEGADGKLTSIYNGLPLRGGERVSLKVKGNCNHNPGLDFLDNPLIVGSITNVLSSTEFETFTLNLVSREAITNETARVPKRYPSSLKISESVKKIIEEYLQTNKKLFIDETQNKYAFMGNLRKPFTILTWLASKSVPVSKSNDATAGFFFFETQRGYNYNSIDGLISSDVFPEKYVYSEVRVDKAPDEDFKILKYTTNRNQNLLESLQRGAFCSNRTFFNPLDFSYTNPQKGLFKLADYKGKAETMGKEIVLPKISDKSGKTLGDIPTRNITGVLDIGTLERGVSTDKNADPAKIQSQAMMRYNTIFTQTVSMTVASNTALHAGDVIECQFPRIDITDKKTTDSEQTGLYMIKELCHHFDSTGSYTALVLIKDTFGQK